MITVWTSCSVSKAITGLSPVLKFVPTLPIKIVNDGSVPEGTQLILALGSDALKKLQEEKIVAKNRTISSLRTVPQMYGKTPVLMSYSPDVGEIDHGYYVDLLTDVGLAVRYVQTGSWKPVYGQYRYVTDFSEMCTAIKQKNEETGDAVDISMDLETIGLDPYAVPKIDHPGAYIVSIQTCCEPGKADVVRFDNRLHEESKLKETEFRQQMEFLLNCQYVRLKGANFKFDLHWLWVRGGFKCSTFKFDTTIVGSLLDENRSNALDVHVKIYVPSLGGYSDVFDRSVDKSRMDLVPADKLLSYAAGDVDGDLQVAEVMKKELLQDAALTKLYVNILHPAARAFEQIEQGGLLVDVPAYKELKSDLEKEHVRLVTEARKILGGRIVAKHNDTSRPGGMNLTKASMLCDFMFSPMGLNLKPKMFTPKADKDGVKRPSTALEHLLMFEDVPEAKEFVRIIKEDGSVMKSLNTYVIGFLEHLRSDGRFHPTYWLFVGNKEEHEGGARTGRLSAVDPAVQTIPKRTKWAKRIRRCFPAPPGYVVVERDYSQGELRVIACIANEDNMLATYASGRDLHIETAAPFAGYTYESLLALKDTNPDVYERVRYLGKAGNFGLVFGMKEDGFMAYAKGNYGVELDWDKAHEFREHFFERYPKLLQYHEIYRKFARENGYVRTPLGRIRHLPLIKSPNKQFASKSERQALNSPVQGTLTDMMLWSIALEHQEGLHDIAPCFGSTHDSIGNYVPEDKVDELVPRLLEVMENLPFKKLGWEPQLKFLADASVGSTMGDLEAYKR